MTEFGWDASDFDWGRGNMDIAAAARAGITLFTHKATEGRTVRHIHFGDAMNRARATGIPLLGAYHVLHTADVSGQVDYLLTYANQAAPWWQDHPGWFWQADCENWGSDFPSPAVCKAFCDELASRTARSVIAYASRGQYGDTLAGLGHPLWNANYPSSRAGPFPALYPGDNGPGWMPYSGQKPIIWQYTDAATIGNQTGCDANAVRDPAALRAIVTGGRTRTEEDRMYALTVPTGPAAQFVLALPYGNADNPAFSIATDTGPGGRTSARWRVAVHVAGGAWSVFTVDTDSTDAARHDVVLPKRTDRASIQRVPVDATDPCTVPATVLAWW
jgi:hypothetical protein